MASDKPWVIGARGIGRTCGWGSIGGAWACVRGASPPCKNGSCAAHGRCEVLPCLVSTGAFRPRSYRSSPRRGSKDVCKRSKTATLAPPWHSLHRERTPTSVGTSVVVNPLRASHSITNLPPRPEHPCSRVVMRDSLTVEPLACISNQLVGLALSFPYDVRHSRAHIPIRPRAHHDVP